MLTHLDKNNQPTMVDVTDKKTSIRMAQALTSVQLPEVIRPFFSGSELTLKKGPVFQTAIIAGTMAVKKTHELIPFCHQIPVEGCKFEITMDENLLVTISCRVKTTFKTGVEMEALHGATVAALTIYDMCKAVSHEITIKETKLIQKTGGKNTIMGRPTLGLILTGGKSERMGEPKALINYKGKAHASYIHDVLLKYCDEVFLSAREGQWTGTELESLPTITDKFENGGPIAGLLSAFEVHPEANWILVACDLIHFNEKTVEKLMANYQDSSLGVAYRNSEKGFPEPLCALYTPEARQVFLNAYENNIRCPVNVLKKSTVTLIDQEEGIDLANINTQAERSHVIN